MSMKFKLYSVPLDLDLNIKMYKAIIFIFHVKGGTQTKGICKRDP